MAKTRIYFITDVHGSNRCFKKFLNAASFYKADVLILGGDITGKAMTAIVQQPDGSYECVYHDVERRLKSKEEVEEVMKATSDSGFYPCIVSRQEFEELHADPEKVTSLFNSLIVKRVGEWMRLAEERLGRTSVKCFVSPGNDDALAIDTVLNSSSYVVNPEEKVVKLDNDHEMITLGTTNHTPWHSPREVDEQVLGEKIDKLASGTLSMKSAVFNIHVPPINTIIDQAPKVDNSLRVVSRSGRVEMISAGSSACRSAIEKYQPMLGIHGHIHESRGMINIGRTMCANPGSEYVDGVLHGFLADLEGDKVKSHLLVTG